MRPPRSSSEIDRAWDLDEDAPAPVVAAGLAGTLHAPIGSLAKGSHATLDAILDDPAPSPAITRPKHDATSIVLPLPIATPNRPGSERLALVAPEPPARQALRRYRRWLIVELACGVAAALMLVLAWSRPSSDHARVSSPPVAGVPAPAKPTSRIAVPIARAPGKKPASKVAAKPIRPKVPATKPGLRPAKQAVRGTKVASATKKPATKSARPHAAKVLRSVGHEGG